MTRRSGVTIPVCVSRLLVRLIALLCLFGAAPMPRATASAPAAVEVRAVARTRATPNVRTRSDRDPARAVVAYAAIPDAPRAKLYLTHRALLI